jgi:hypothetical protein
MHLQQSAPGESWPLDGNGAGVDRCGSIASVVWIVEASSIVAKLQGCASASRG